HELAQILWDYHHVPDELQPADVIIGLGSYDDRVGTKAAEILLAGWAPIAIFSGADGNFTRGVWDRPEADVFTDAAIAAGANSEQIWQEPRATNTGENVKYSRALCQERGLDVKTVIMVSKPQMNRRGLSSFGLYWPEVKVICAAFEAHFLQGRCPGKSEYDVICELVGDMQRIIEYPAMGYQKFLPYPDAAREAFEVLRSRGYTDHCFQ
ncbi:MAG: YdcF family protein, partial [Verrucomicrobiota bacterium]